MQMYFQSKYEDEINYTGKKEDHDDSWDISGRHCRADRHFQCSEYGVYECICPLFRKGFLAQQ